MRVFLQSLLCVLLFYPFRLRDVESWNPSVEITLPWAIPAVVGDLAHFLYDKYPTPPFMAFPFQHLSLSIDQDSFLPEITQIVVYILFARGVRLSKVSSTGWLQISPAMARELFSVPEKFSFRNGLVWARLRSMGIDERVCSWLADDLFYSWSWNDAYHSISPGWLDTAQWFNRNHHQMSEAGASHVLEWFTHEAIEWLRVTGNPDLSQFFLFEKRSLQMVMEQVENYETAVRMRPSGPDLRWSGKGWDQTITIGSRRFQFSELLSSKELSSEGKAMRHCVGVAGYDIACKKVEIAIFSVRAGEKRVATIEIEMKTKRIRRAFGQSNSKLEPLTYQAVNEWKDWVCTRNQVPDP